MLGDVLCLSGVCSQCLVMPCVCLECVHCDWLLPVLLMQCVICSHLRAPTTRASSSGRSQTLPRSARTLARAA